MGITVPARQNRFFALLIAGLLLLSSARVSNAGWATRELLNLNGTADTGADSMSSLASDGLDTWVSAWSSQEDLGGTLGTDSDILFTASFNGGQSWLMPAAVDIGAAGDTNGDISPAVAIGGDTWIVVWSTSFPVPGTSDWNADVVVARSTNGGATWSSPQRLHADAALNTPVPTARLATDSAGTWIVTWESSDDLGGIAGIDPDVFVARSTDDGLSWTNPQLVTTHTHRADTAPDIAFAGSAWVVAWSSIATIVGPLGATYEIYRATSTDGGATFSAPQKLHTASSDDMRVTLAADSSGTLLATWQVAEGLGGTLGADLDLVFAMSTDAGVSWSSPTAMNSTASTDTGADSRPRATTDGNGNWMVVWQSQDSLSGTVGTDDDVLFALSEDDGSTWSVPLAVNSDASADNNDDRRPQVATDGNGIWMVTWTGGDPMGPAAGDGDVYRTSNPCQDVLGNRSFVHTATAADIISSATTINDARLNGNNLARILVTPNLTPGGGGAVLNDHPISAYYIDSGVDRWAILNSDNVAMTVGASFNVRIIDSGARTFDHLGSAATVITNHTLLDPAIGGASDSILLVTDYSVPGIATNPHPMGVWWTGARWSIFNQDIAAMTIPLVHVIRDTTGDYGTFVHTASTPNITGANTVLDHVELNGNRNAIFQVTQNWNPGGATGVYNSANIGVFWDGLQWRIHNQNGATMPEGASFNISIDNSCGGTPNVTLCRNGILEGTEECEVDAFGLFNPCCDRRCRFFTPAAAHVCRAATDTCDAPDLCPGGSDLCAADLLIPGSPVFVCRPSIGTCDIEEACDGLSKACPADAVVDQDVGLVCRASGGPCDIVELCDGTNTCPSDEVASPADAHVCRPASDLCDATEICDGTNKACPGDLPVPASPPTECNSAAHECDVAELCDGINNACPTNLFAPAGSPAPNHCDDQEVCTLDICGVDGGCDNSAPNPAPNVDWNGDGSVTAADHLDSDADGIINVCDNCWQDCNPPLLNSATGLIEQEDSDGDCASHQAGRQLGWTLATTPECGDTCDPCPRFEEETLFPENPAGVDCSTVVYNDAHHDCCYPNDSTAISTAPMCMASGPQVLRAGGGTGGGPGDPPGSASLRIPSGCGGGGTFSITGLNKSARRYWARGSGIGRFVGAYEFGPAGANFSGCSPKPIGCVEWVDADDSTPKIGLGVAGVNRNDVSPYQFGIWENRIAMHRVGSSGSGTQITDKCLDIPCGALDADNFPLNNDFNTHTRLDNPSLGACCDKPTNRLCFELDSFSSYGAIEPDPLCEGQALKSRLQIVKLHLPQNQKLIFQGRIFSGETYDEEGRAPDQLSTRVVLRNSAGDIIWNHNIPRGSWNSSARQGWKTNRNRTVFTYLDRTRPGAIVKLRLKRTNRKDPSEVSVKLVASRLDLPLELGDEPLSLEIHDDGGDEPQCFAASFLETGQTCIFNAAHKVLVCRS